MVRCGLTFGAAFIVGIAGMPGAGPASPTFDLRLVAVEDSGTYFVYRYTAVNGPRALYPVSEIFLDVEATGDAPRSLPSSGGRFYDLTTFGSSPTPYAPVGPATPVGWTAILTGDAELGWQADAGVYVHLDSIAPGDSLGGFAVRSPYLLGVASVRALPAFQSCCSPPESADDPGNAEFQVVSHTPGPRFPPGLLGLTVLAEQVTTVCTDPLWIDDPALCNEMGDSLDAASARLAIGDYEGAGAATSAVGALAESNRTMNGGEVGDNAYWLLSMNSDHVSETMLVAGPPRRVP